MKHSGINYYIPIKQYHVIHNHYRIRVKMDPYTDIHPLTKDEIEKRKEFLDWLETLFKSDFIPDELLRLQPIGANSTVLESACKVYEEVYHRTHNTNGILPTSVQKIHFNHDEYDGPSSGDAVHRKFTCPYVESLGERNVYKGRDRLTRFHEFSLTKDFEDARLGYANESEVETHI